MSGVPSKRQPIVKDAAFENRLHPLDHKASSDVRVDSLCGHFHFSKQVAHLFIFNESFSPRGCAIQTG